MSSRVIVQSIFYSNPDYYPPIINSAHLLAKSGFHHQHLCREYMDRMSINYPNEMEITRVASATKNSLIEYLNFIREAMRWGRSDAKVFIGHDMHGFLVARLLGWRYKKPVIYHCHDFTESPKTFGARWVKRFETRFARTADVVIVPDTMRSKIIAEQLKLRKPPFIVANCPLKIAPVGHTILADTLYNKYKKRFSKVLLRIGKIGGTHGLETTLRSIPLWQNSEWGFVIIGPGDSSYLESLSTLAEELGVAPQFAILPPVSYDTIAHFVGGAHMGHGLYEANDINSLHNSTASNKYAEYMAAKLPILLADTPGNKALVNKYKNGVCVDVASAQEIAMAVNRILGDDHVANQMGGAGLKAFSHELNYTRQFEPVLSTLATLTER